jgi:tetratricopeptide (TPR) repeat protein
VLSSALSFGRLKVKKTSNVKYYLAASVALMTLLIYLPALQNEFVDWDDNAYVFENPYIRSIGAPFFKWAFSNVSTGNWHPLTWISHALDYAVWGLNPMGHHLTSIILHALNAFLVVVLVIMLLDAFIERTRENDGSPFLTEQSVLVAAGTTGLLFGIHPLHVESVAWVSERKDLLCALFFLLSIMAYVRYADDVSDKTHRAERIGSTPCAMRFAFFTNKHYLSALGFFVLALLSKPMAVTLPVVLLILDWHPLDRVRSLKAFQSACVEKLPFFILSLASSIVAVFAQRAGGALVSLSITPLPTRVLVAAKAVIAYLGKMVWPLNLVPFYPYPKKASFASWEYFAPAALAAGITVLCVVLAKKKRKVWLTAWGYFMVTLVPVLGIVQVGVQSMADRYDYLPSLGLFLVMGVGAAWLWEKASTQKKLEPFVKLFIGAAAACMVFFLSFATVEQTGVWKNTLSLWNYVIAKEPDASLAYNNRGQAYDEIGQFDQAIKDFDRAIALAPSDYLGFANRGRLYGKTGRLDKAIEVLEKAIALNPSHLDAYNIRVNMGVAYAEAGRIDKAIEQFDNAVLMDQDHALAYKNRGMLYAMTGDKERAALDFQKACDLGDSNGCIGLHELTRGGAHSP